MRIMRAFFWDGLVQTDCEGKTSQPLENGFGAWCMRSHGIGSVPLKRVALPVPYDQKCALCY